MQRGDRNLLETQVIAQLAQVEQELARLQAERDTLKDILLRVRREGSRLRDVTRKNSFDRILVENTILQTLQSAGKAVPTKRLYWRVIEANPRLRSTTFRSHLHRLKERGLITNQNQRGNWILIPQKSPLSPPAATSTEPDRFQDYAAASRATSGA